ncbi:MAG: GIY-YIG nuclease family protein [Candidatus Loosdrechtia sp.]|uniref:GIY-YIG nuclease family protein n=1 Tax=Candidatus Loosdrechtia sp. TaxID=3101272 RepID=UPI003A791EB5|nr:MAG: GIY-YIG nuclease family protein [Candidatus Jettenia sp. AMX2]
MRNIDKLLCLDNGIYNLIIKISQKCIIKIGHLGTYGFSGGFYVYTGSAQKNLRQRIKRHLKQEKRLHWHIDYLLQYGEIVNIYERAGKKEGECVLSRKIGTIKNAAVPVKGFGSSDCSCITHLYYFRHNPEADIKKIVS